MDIDYDYFLKAAFDEDVKDGDHSTLASIDEYTKGKAVLKIKENGVLAGINVAEQIFKYLEPQCSFKKIYSDGALLKIGDIAFTINANVHTILKAERLVLNTMQRMSGIATLTKQYVDKIQNYQTKLLDTRKTTPLFRTFEKMAVKIGGGHNHRFGLYDMIMLKDNHIDYCGGITKAIQKTNKYLKETNKNLAIEIETRNLDEVKEVLSVGGVQRIMLDNFSPSDVKKAVSLIAQKYETEASGGITLDTIESYAQTGVDFISSGALIHHAVSLDLSLKAEIA